MRIFLDIKARSTEKIRDFGIVAYAKLNTAEPFAITVKEEKRKPKIWLFPKYRTGDMHGISDEELRRLLNSADEIISFDAKAVFCLWKFLLNRTIDRMPEPDLHKFHSVKAQAEYYGLPLCRKQLASIFHLRMKSDNRNLDRLLFSSKQKRLSVSALSDFMEASKSRMELLNLIFRCLPPFPTEEEFFWRLNMQIHARGIPVNHQISSTKYAFRRCEFLNLEEAFSNGFLYFAQFSTKRLIRKLRSFCQGVMKQQETDFPCTAFLSVRQTGKHLVLTLPSKRKIYFYAPELTDKGVTVLTEQNRVWVRQLLSCRVLREKLFRAMKRDLIAYTIQNLEECFFRVVSYSDREIICEDPPSHELDALFKEICNKIPPWAAGMGIIRCFDTITPAGETTI